METQLTIALAMIALTTVVQAADTGSEVLHNESRPTKARGWGHGDWVHSKSRVGTDISRGSSLATDRTSISFSNTSVFRTLAGDALGNTLNITVGPGRASTATGHAGTHGHPNGVYVRGYSDPEQAQAVTKARGEQFETNARAINVPGLRFR